MLIHPVHHVRRNVVGYLALVLALGGTTYAAWLAPANSVNSAAIIDGQVTTPDLAANAIRADEFCLSTSCVGSKEIADNAVSSSELAAGSVATAKLGTAAVVNAKLGADAVTGDKVKDGSLTAADIAGGIPPAAEAFIARHDGTVTISGSGATVVWMDLPAGVYTLTALSTIINLDVDPQSSDCTLSTGASGFIHQPGEADGYGAQVAVEDLLTLTSPGRVTLHCHTYNGYAQGTKLIAVKVAAIHG